jgi:hypothetical protein
MMDAVFIFFASFGDNALSWVGLPEKDMFPIGGASFQEAALPGILQAAIEGSILALEAVFVPSLFPPKHIAKKIGYREANGSSQHVQREIAYGHVILPCFCVGVSEGRLACILTGRP